MSESEPDKVRKERDKLRRALVQFGRKEGMLPNELSTHLGMGLVELCYIQDVSFEAFGNFCSAMKKMLKEMQEKKVEEE